MGRTARRGSRTLVVAGAFGLVSLLRVGCGGAPPPSPAAPTTPRAACPLRTVWVPPARACVDVAPVSLGAYSACSAAGDCPSSDAYGHPEEVVRVSRSAARALCAWRSGRLPTTETLTRALADPDVHEAPDAPEWTAGGSGSGDLATAAFRCVSEPGPGRVTWDRPLCVAYSAADDAYACLHYEIYDESGLGFMTSDVEVLHALLAQRGDLAPDEDGYAPVFEGARALAVITPDGAGDPVERIPLLRSVDGASDGGAAVELRREGSLEEALRQVERRGFRPGGVRASPVEPGRWRRVLGSWVYVEPRYRSGGGISEHLEFDVTVACERERRPPLERREGTAFGGVWAFVADGASSFVVATLPWSGGEGTGGLATHYRVFRDACRQDAHDR